MNSCHNILELLGGIRKHMINIIFNVVKTILKYTPHIFGNTVMLMGLFYFKVQKLYYK